MGERDDELTPLAVRLTGRLEALDFSVSSSCHCSHGLRYSPSLSPSISLLFSPLLTSVLLGASLVTSLSLKL